MFCKNCGIKSEYGKKFCSHCGSALETSYVEVLTPATHMPASAKKEPWTFGSVTKVIGIVGVVGVLAVLGIISSADDDSIKTNNDALSNYDSGNSQQAISQFQQASQSAVNTDTKINTLKNLAYVYSSEGQDDQALKTFEQALALTSDGSFDYYLVAGEIAVLEDKPNSAQISYNKAYQLSPNDFQINNALALFYLNLSDSWPQYQDYKKALGYAQKAVQLTDLEIAKQNLGMAYYFNDNYPQAISTLSSITLDKDSYTAYFLGLSYAGNEDVVNAKLYLRKAIANGVEVPQEVYDYLNSH